MQQEIRFDSKTETLRTAYETLLETIECLFLKNTDALLTNIIPGKVQPSGGSTHRSKDKTPYLHLLEKDWWDTPVHLLAGQAMRERESQRQTQLTLHPARPADRKFVFELVNDEQVRAMSFQSGHVDWNTHCDWFARQLSEQAPFYMATRNEEPCGYVRFQNRGSDHWRQDAHDAIVTLAVHPGFRQQGIAAAMLRAACRDVLETTSIRRVHALVKTCNQASLATFRKCRFYETGTTAFLDMPAACFVYPGYEE